MSSVGRECAACGQSDGVHMSDCHLLHTAVRGQTFQFPNQAEIERLQKVVADQALTIGTLKDELERERMRLAGCSVAATGYFDGCLPEYESAALRDTVRLYAEKERLRRLVEGFEMERDHAHHLLSEERKLTAATAAHTTALERKVAELRESLRRIVGHLEYEARQGDGIAEDAYGDYSAAKSLLAAAKPGATP